MAANKPTAVHFSLIFFVMATIITGVMAYMYYDDGRALRSSLVEAEKKANDQKNAALKYSTQLDALKAKVGHQFPNVGETGDEPQTVLFAMNEDIRKYGKGQLDPQQTTYTAALAAVSKELETAKVGLTTAETQVQKLNSDVATLKTTYQKDVDLHRDERTKVEQARQTAEVEHQKAQQVKNDEILAKQTAYNQLQLSKDQAEQAHQQQVTEMKDHLARLESRNNSLRDQIDQATRTSFERPDGIVRWVDNNAHLVWINLGSADNLTKQTNFSVYKKNNRGVGRDSTPTETGPEDKKGAIEVTRVLGPHLAEARILDEDYFEPIGEGDPIYTPIWSANQIESFAFVGGIDLDNDGRTDRELLHEILASVGAKIQVEVTDGGERLGGAIDEQTKFLVIGKKPDLAELTDQKEKDAATKVLEHLQDLQQEAREQGVRVVTLNDFMAFIGYTPRQRVFRPGDQRPFSLKAGARSTSTSETLGNRESSGQTSGVYSRSKVMKPSSSGSNSGFRGGSR